MPSKSIFKVTLLFLFTTLLSGCYSQWKDADLFVNQFSCNSNRADIIKLVLSKGAKIIEDSPEYLQIQKKWDVVAIQFAPPKTAKDKDTSSQPDKEKMLKVYIAAIQVKLLGFGKKQGAPFLALDCDK